MTNEEKEAKIADLRGMISYWTEKLKVVLTPVERAELNDKILNAKREIGKLNSKTLDRVKKVDIIDAPPVADRLEAESNRSRSGTRIERNKVTFTIT